MLSGRAFQVAGPACENARSPNFVRSRDEVEDVRSPERDLLAPTDWTVARQIRRAATVVDGVDEAAHLEPYSVADRQPMQMDQGRRDVLEATEDEHQSGIGMCRWRWITCCAAPGESCVCCSVCRFLSARYNSFQGRRL